MSPIFWWTEGMILFFGAYMLARNELVYRFRMRVLDGKDGLRLHDSLPPYEVMVHRFWVWPLERFFPNVTLRSITRIPNCQCSFCRQMRNQMRELPPPAGGAP